MQDTPFNWSPPNTPGFHSEQAQHALWMGPACTVDGTSMHCGWGYIFVWADNKP